MFIGGYSAVPFHNGTASASPSNRNFTLLSTPSACACHPISVNTGDFCSLGLHLFTVSNDEASPWSFSRSPSSVNLKLHPAQLPWDNRPVTAFHHSSADVPVCPEGRRTFFFVSSKPRAEAGAQGPHRLGNPGTSLHEKCSLIYLVQPVLSLIGRGMTSPDVRSASTAAMMLQ